MFRINIVRDSIVSKGKTPFVAFTVEMRAEGVLLFRLSGWRLINGYIAAPSYRTAAGFFQPLFRVGPEMAEEIYRAVAEKFVDWATTCPDLGKFKSMVDAVEEILVPGCTMTKDA